MHLLLLACLLFPGIPGAATLDADHDGYPCDLDCDDANPDINPGAAEVCNGIDDNCNDVVDDPAALTSLLCCADADADGYGNANDLIRDCACPEGRVANCGDCDDTNAAINPNALEVPGDFIDSDCDSQDACFFDGDGDRHGSTERMFASTEDCTNLYEAVVDDDCDDGNARVHPGTDETCDGLDNDCDLVVDEDPVDASTWYADADADGWTGDASTVSCDPPSGFGEASSEPDCDEGNEHIYPGAPERLDDGIDQDCDGADATTEDTSATEPPEKKCGCSVAPGTAGFTWLLGILALVRRRR